MYHKDQLTIEEKGRSPMRIIEHMFVGGTRCNFDLAQPLSYHTIMTEARVLWEPIQNATISVTEPIVVIEQTAIPWCVTHDSNINGPVDYCAWSESQYPIDKLDCAISLGGPDHKWWRDDS